MLFYPSLALTFLSSPRDSCPRGWRGSRGDYHCRQSVRSRRLRARAECCSPVSSAQPCSSQTAPAVNAAGGSSPAKGKKQRQGDTEWQRAEHNQIMEWHGAVGSGEGRTGKRGEGQRGTVSRREIEIWRHPRATSEAIDQQSGGSATADASRLAPRTTYAISCLLPLALAVMTLVFHFIYFVCEICCVGAKRPRS